MNLLTLLRYVWVPPQGTLQNLLELTFTDMVVLMNKSWEVPLLLPNGDKSAATSEEMVRFGKLIW